MAINFRVENVTKSTIKNKDVIWVSAVDGEVVIVQIAVPYNSDPVVFRQNIIDKMTPHIKKYRNRQAIKVDAQSIAGSIDVAGEVV